MAKFIYKISPYLVFFDRYGEKLNVNSYKKHFFYPELRITVSSHTFSCTLWAIFPFPDGMLLKNETDHNIPTGMLSP